MPYLQLENGRKLYYEEEGAGRPVVFIHGWKASADVYAEPSRLLTQAGNYRCIRYDHCGHKRSDAPDSPATLQTLAQDLHSLITALQLEKPILVGWSMGGMTVQEYIRRYGMAYDIPSPKDRELMQLFHSRCEKAGIVHDNEKIFAYLNEFETKDTQLSLF